LIYSQHFPKFAIVEIKSKIGNRIKELRDVKKMSQKDLAYASDLDRSYIASVENGQRNISIVNIEKIAVALGVTIKEFFKDNKFDDNTGSS
jgi:transcriptional regulator with XRE-family HTH domain